MLARLNFKLKGCSSILGYVSLGKLLIVPIELSYGNEHTRLLCVTLMIKQEMFHV